MNKTQATAIVLRHLQKVEAGMNRFGSALPHAKERPQLRLVLVDGYPKEHEFGWVFVYSTKQFIESNDPKHAIAGNAPLIVSRDDGLLYVTGTAQPLQFYIDEFKNGKRVLAEPGAAAGGAARRR